jgi:hypothetical protein
MDLALEVPSVLARETLKKLEKNDLSSAQLKRLVRRYAGSVLVRTIPTSLLRVLTIRSSSRCASTRDSN